MIRRIKDATVAKGFKAFVNTQIKAYGSMLKLALDSGKKEIRFEVMLEGEIEPLRVEISRYELSQEGEKYFVRLYGIHTSRAWINTLAESYLEDRAIELPSEYAKMLKMVV